MRKSVLLSALIAAMASLPVFANPLPIGKYSVRSGVSAGSCNTLVSTSTNTAGLILRNLVLENFGGPNQTQTILVIDTTAPSNFTSITGNGTQHFLAIVYFGGPFNDAAQYEIPAGYGLFACANGPGAATISYDLLQ